MNYPNYPELPTVRPGYVLRSLVYDARMKARTISVATAHESTWRLAEAIAAELDGNGRPMSQVLMHGLRLWIKYAENAYPVAVATAREKTGVVQ